MDKVRRFADDPARIAQIVERRTSQPHDAILAMITRQTLHHSDAGGNRPKPIPSRTDRAQAELHVVRTDERDEIVIIDLPAV
jgi:hypothetical protein